MSHIFKNAVFQLCYVQTLSILCIYVLLYIIFVCNCYSSRECLISLLFVTNVYLQKALMYVHYICDSCTNGNPSRIVLFEVDRKITYDVVDFLDIQDQQCLKASQQILSLRKTITKTILYACQVSYVYTYVGQLISNNRNLPVIVNSKCTVFSNFT